MANWVYTDTVKEHFLNPRNIWSDKENFVADGEGEVGSLACGDQMRVGIKIKNDKILDIRWLTYGCASAIASTSIMSEMVKGMTLKEAYNLTPDKITGALGGLPEHKFHCSVLGDKALRAAIDDYLAKNNLANPYKENVAVLICECKNITDQMIEELVQKKEVKTFEELQDKTGLGSVCGNCIEKAKSLFEELCHIHGIH